MANDYYNEFDEDQVNKLYKKRKKKKLKRRFKLLIVFLILLVVIGYFVTDLSKVKNIKVTGNSNVKDSKIIEASELNNSSFYLLINKSKVAKKIEEISLIKDASISYDLLGNVTIKVEESKQVAYCVINKKTYILDELGDVVQTKDSKVKEKLKSTPRLSKFKSLKFLKEFAKEYAKVPSIIKSQTSDIIYAPKKSDTNRVRFILNNGKELIVRLDDMAEELSKFPIEAYMSKYDNKCTFDFYGDNIYMKDCGDK